MRTRAAEGTLQLVVVGPYPADPSVIRNGVEAVVVYLLEGLRRLPDLTIQVISVSDEIGSDSRVERDGVVIHYLRSARRLRNLTFDAVNRSRVRGLVRELAPDLVHVHSTIADPYLSRRPPQPTVTTVHGLMFEEVKYDRGRLDWLRRGPRRWLERSALRHARELVAVSAYVKRAVQPFTTARIAVLENPVGARYFSLAEEAWPEAARTRTSACILFAGTIMRRKNLLDLLRAVEQVRSDWPAVELRVAGGVQDEAYLATLQQYVAHHHLEPNVRFLGRLPDPELLEEYRRCTVVASASHEETAGMVFQQAMASGKPVVGTRVGGVPDIIEHEETGLVVAPGDVSALAEALRALLGNPDLRRRLGESGRRAALSRFTPAIAAEKTMELYREILLRQQAPGVSR